MHNVTEQVAVILKGMALTLAVGAAGAVILQILFWLVPN